MKDEPRASSLYLIFRLRFVYMPKWPFFTFSCWVELFQTTGRAALRLLCWQLFQSSHIWVQMCCGRLSLCCLPQSGCSQLDGQVATCHNGQIMMISQCHVTSQSIITSVCIYATCHCRQVVMTLQGNVTPDQSGIFVIWIECYRIKKIKRVR